MVATDSLLSMRLPAWPGLILSAVQREILSSVPSYNLGSLYHRSFSRCFAQLDKIFAESVNMEPEGCGSAGFGFSYTMNTRQRLPRAAVKSRKGMQLVILMLGVNKGSDCTRRRKCRSNACYSLESVTFNFNMERFTH